MKSVDENVAKKVIELGKLALLFARINRATMHEDGITPESDTDHTVMLSLVACAFAEQYAPHLDIGRIAQLALIHDLVEAYAGDTPTNWGNVPQEVLLDKERREKEAFLRIKSEFEHTFPWVHTMIEEYESLESPEARYVKALDKTMPKITHVLNDASVIHTMNETIESLTASLSKQQEKIKNTYGHDQEAVRTLAELLKEETIEAYKRGTKK